MITQPVPVADLGESAVCGTCGRPYLKRDGHSCSGPRSSLLLLLTTRYVAEVSALRAELVGVSRRIGDMRTGISEEFSRIPRSPQRGPTRFGNARSRAAELGWGEATGGAA